MRGASRTAEVVCFLRALEAGQPDAVLEDPHAEGFLRPTWRLALAAARPLGLRGGWPGLGTFVLARHRWFDERLSAALDDGAREVLILGAGYDSRAARFAGRARFWEVDHPATAARKRRIAPDHPAERVDVDFERQSLAEELVRAGFPVGSRCFVVWEGVTMYLTRSAVRATLGSLRDLLGPGSELVFDAYTVLDGPGLAGHMHRIAPALMPVVGEPVTFFVHPDDIGSLLASEGWSLRETADADALKARFAPDRVMYAPTFVTHASR